MTRDLGRWRGHVVAVAQSSNQRGKVLLTALPGEAPPEEFAAIPRSRLVGLEVSPAELDEWWSTRTVFTWRGKPFTLIRDEGDRISGTLVGPDDAWAAANGLWVVERGHATGTFDRTEVEDLREERTDLLAGWRERTQTESRGESAPR